MSKQQTPITVVAFSKIAEKQIMKIPKHIQVALRYWIESVEFSGIRETRKLSGYHDEPLKGQRIGQHSVRLNRAYRVIYTEIRQDIEILIIEVNKHEY